MASGRHTTRLAGYGFNSQPSLRESRGDVSGTSNNLMCATIHHGVAALPSQIGWDAPRRSIIIHVYAATRLAPAGHPPTPHPPIPSSSTGPSAATPLLAWTESHPGPSLQPPTCSPPDTDCSSPCDLPVVDALVATAHRMDATGVSNHQLLVATAARTDSSCQRSHARERGPTADAGSGPESGRIRRTPTGVCHVTVPS